MATYIWDQIEKCNNRISRCLSLRELAAATYYTRLRHQSVSTVREGKGRRRARRHLAGAEEAGDDGGGNAGIQRLRVEGGF